MILEGVVTTENTDGTVNLAPMGPIVDEQAATSGDIEKLTLRPFPDSTTFANLRRNGRGVFHVVDDVELLARAAIGRLAAAPRFVEPVEGLRYVLADACRWYAFEVCSIDEAGQRVVIDAQVTRRGRLRDFIGFHRARHAVLEAAILATRVHILPFDEIQREFARLATIVDKTGGEAEHRALALLQSYVTEHAPAVCQPPAGKSLRVIAPSRLHFGLLALGQAATREFGGVGAMIDRPGLELLLEPHNHFRVEGPLAARIEEFASRATAHWNADSSPPCRLRLVRVPRQHVGLGTGTQLGLAVAAALHSFAGRALPPAVELAALVGRGRRSAIGVYGFLGGGLIVEAGKLPGDPLAPLVTRIPLPADWRFVLVTPKHAQGMAGEAERRAFDLLPAVPATTTDRLCREILLELIPAALAGDLPTFGEALFRYNRSAGECFAQAQGGVFASNRVEQFVNQIRSLGVAGVGQSSWGPTVFALAEDDTAARRLRDALRGESAGCEADYDIAAPNSSGAQLDIV